MSQFTKNILVIRTDRIGDVVLTIPALRSLRKAFPHARLTVLVTPSNAELISGAPFVDQVLCDDRQKRHRGFVGFWRLVREIKRHNFHIAVNFHTKKRTNLLCALAGIPKRIGYRNNKYGFLLTDQVPDDRPQGLKHEVQYCLDLIKLLGAENQETELFLPVDARNEEWADHFLQQFSSQAGESLIAVHADASCPTKRWPFANFCQLLKELREKYHARFIFVGSKPLADADKECLSDIPIIDSCGQTSVGQVVSLLRKSRMLISNDSGPVHLAAAVGIPVVSIFTRNQPGINPERWKPLGKKSSYVAPLPDMSQSFAKGEIENPDFLSRVSVPEVLSVVDEVWNLC